MIIQKRKAVKLQHTRHLGDGGHGVEAKTRNK